MSRTCHCVNCGACGGSGNIWLDSSGRYLGQHRSDDLDEMEACDECRGTGLSEMCELCTDSLDDDRI